MAVKRISPNEALALLDEGYTYLDVRSVPEYQQGHPRGAQNVPLMHAGPGGMAPNAHFLAVAEANFPKDAKLVVGCKTGGRSQQAAAVLSSLGFTSVVDVQGGFSGMRDPFGRVTAEGWADAGLPVAKAADPGKSYADLLEKIR